MARDDGMYAVGSPTKAVGDDHWEAAISFRATGIKVLVVSGTERELVRIAANAAAAALNKAMGV